jgi:hypothetical protein
LLIHEVTHAILDRIYRGKDLDGKTSSMNVLDEEAIAYLAGAIYLYVSNGGTPLGKGNPEYQAYQIIKTRIDREITPDGCTVVKFSTADLRPLLSAIRSHNLYKDEWRDKATHNGFSRGLKVWSAS